MPNIDIYRFSHPLHQFPLTDKIGVCFKTTYKELIN